MTQHEYDAWIAEDARLPSMLQQLLAVPEVEVRPALSQAATLIADTFGVDKVDVFFYDAVSDSLLALGVSQTAMGEHQRALGFDRLPRTNGRRAAWGFRTSETYVTGRADEDPQELRGIVDGLGVRSIMNLPFDVDGRRRGILQLDSATPDFFTEHDVAALSAVTRWIGLIMHRAEFAERLLADTARRARSAAADEVARLTRRQREVASLIAEGRSNGESAQRLTLTEGTVANHMEAILRRLDLKSRTQIAVSAVERGLYRSGMLERDESHPCRRV
jgi:DNA-binding CsgD family transcriptional regulator